MTKKTMTKSRMLALALPAMAATLFALPPAALAGCDTEAGAKAELIRIDGQLSTIQQSQNAQLDAALNSLDAKGAKLGWSRAKMGGIVEDIMKSERFKAFQVRKEKVAQRVEKVQQQLDAPSVKKDPLKACKIGLQYEPLINELRDIGNEEIKFISSTIQAAK